MNDIKIVFGGRGTELLLTEGLLVAVMTKSVEDAEADLREAMTDGVNGVLVLTAEWRAQLDYLEWRKRLARERITVFQSPDADIRKHALDYVDGYHKDCALTRQSLFPFP